MTPDPVWSRPIGDTIRVEVWRRHVWLVVPNDEAGLFEMPLTVSDLDELLEVLQQAREQL